MLAYVTVGTADIEKSKAFYSELLADLGAKIVMDIGRLTAFGTDQGGAMFAICEPYDKGEPNQGNGNMVSIAAGSIDMVDKLYAKAISLNGADEGEPGQRMDGFYGGYFRDLDGNKICFCHFG
jgi:predicted lactoylglutathione lyase